MSAEAHPVVIAYAGLLGLVLGSFLNVCILRWGAEPKQSVVRPRSRCPRCGHEIRWYENIPVLSWIALRARCSQCGLSISPLYPAVELGTGLLWAGAVVLLGPTLAALQLAVAATLLLGIAVSDARAFIIPHEFSLGGTVIALAFAGAMGGGERLMLAAEGALFGAGIVLLVGEVTELILGQEAMGGGDCALMGMVGAFFGWEAVLPVVALGACVSLVLYFVAALLPRRGTPAAPAGDEGEPAGLRWGKVLRLLAGGIALVGGLGLALRAGAMPAV
ncbi:MAG TPA: prepilin peptidase, partial [Gemmatimonadales bacterium]|nr:prepilin peptidase [Gemmatimonadales bacterium]